MKSWETGLDQGIFFLAVKPSLNFSLTKNYKYSYLKPTRNSNWGSPALLADAVTAKPCSQGLNAITPCASLWRLSCRASEAIFQQSLQLICFAGKLLFFENSENPQMPVSYGFKVNCFCCDASVAKIATPVTTTTTMTAAKKSTSIMATTTMTGTATT